MPAEFTPQASSKCADATPNFILKLQILIDYSTVSSHIGQS